MAGNCGVCLRKILAHCKNIMCVICKRKYHCKCISMDITEITQLLASENWFCPSCTGEILPFNHIHENAEFF